MVVTPPVIDLKSPDIGRDIFHYIPQYNTPYTLHVYRMYI